MSDGKKLNTAATAPAKIGDKVVTVKQNGTTQLTDVGYGNGMIPHLMFIPNVPGLIKNGYMPSGSKNNDISEYAKGVLRYLADKAPCGGVFIGQINPGTSGFFIANMYDIAVNGGVDADGLPKYSMGLLMELINHNIVKFGTNAYEFWIKTT